MKKSAVLVIIGLVLIVNGCASLGERLGSKINYVIPKSQVVPGEVVELTVVLPKGVKRGWVKFLNRKFPLYARRDMEERTYTAYLPVPGKVKPGRYSIQAFFPYYQMKDKPPISELLYVQILPNYTARSDHYDRGRRFNIKQYEADRKLIQQTVLKSTYRPDKLRDFLLPLGGRVVSSYGTFRTYQKKYEIALKGLEIIPVSTGTLEVNAAAEGKVVMARRLPMFGRCVIIDHGHSFMTAYYHLGSMSVKAGDKVDRGAEIGKVGRSGNAAVGKRLYYQLFVAGIPVNIKRYMDLEIYE